jgi:hypothetical protein
VTFVNTSLWIVRAQFCLRDVEASRWALRPDKNFVGFHDFLHLTAGVVLWNRPESLFYCPLFILDAGRLGADDTKDTCISSVLFASVCRVCVASGDLFFFFNRQGQCVKSTTSEPVCSSTSYHTWSLFHAFVTGMVSVNDTERGRCKERGKAVAECLLLVAGISPRRSELSLWAPRVRLCDVWQWCWDTGNS